MFIGADDPAWFKYLGRIFQHDLGDDRIRLSIRDKLLQWLKLVDTTLLTGPMKAWITNHHVCAKLAWSLMIYDFPESQAAEWQAMLHRYYRRWMGLAACAEPFVLYRFEEHFGLKFKDLKQVLRQLQVTRWHILKNSKDRLARALYQFRLAQDRAGHIGKGRHSSPCMELEKLEDQLRIHDVIGNGQTGRRGLGYGRTRGKRRVVASESSKQRRQRMVELMKVETEQQRLEVLHEYKMQNSWLSYAWLDGMMAKDLTWGKMLFQYSDRLLKFVLNAQLNTLPSPDNLRRWNRYKDGACGLCGTKGVTLAHILAGVSGCATASIACLGKTATLGGTTACWQFWPSPLRLRSMTSTRHPWWSDRLIRHL